MKKELGPGWRPSSRWVALISLCMEVVNCSLEYHRATSQTECSRPPYLLLVHSHANHQISNGAAPVADALSLFKTIGGRFASNQSSDSLLLWA